MQCLGATPSSSGEHKEPEIKLEPSGAEPARQSFEPHSWPTLVNFLICSNPQGGP